MKLWMLNPFIRNALRFLYEPKGFPVYIRDCHLIYVERGNLAVRMENLDCELHAGEMIYLPVGSVYELYLRTPGEYPLLMVVDFDLTQAENEYTEIYYPLQYCKGMQLRKFSDYTDYVQIAGEGSFLPDVKIFHSTPEVDMLRRIIREFECGDVLGKDIAESALKEFLLILHRTSATKQWVDPIVEGILQVLSAHIQDPVDNALLAAQYGYHVNSLERLFRKHTGMSIRQTHLTLRIQKARRLLAESSLSLKEIANQTGFTNYSYFSDYFKKKMGMPPGEYRKQCRQIE